MSSQFGSSTGDTTIVDQQPPSPLAPSAPEVLPPQPELPPSPPPELPPSELPPSPAPELPPSPQPELPPFPQPQPTQPLPQITQPLAQPPLQSTQLQAQPWQPAELQHQAAVTGASPGPTLTISAPPAYSEVTKDQPQQPVQYLPQQGAYPVQLGAHQVQQGAYPVQHVQQPGQPQYMFTQQPAVQLGIQTTPYMMRAQLQPVAFPRPNYPGPHDFHILIMITASILGLLNPTSLVFGIPATLFSGQSKEHKYRGDYPAAKKYANVALGLIITTIIYVLGGAIFAIGMSLGLHYQYLCTRSFSYC